MTKNDLKKLRVAEYAEMLPSKLLTARELSNALSEGGIALGADRITELADAFYIPHFRVDGGPPLFKAQEARKWIGANLTTHALGQRLPLEYRVIVESGVVGVSSASVPRALAQIADKLIEQPRILNGSGIYFLCRGGRVVYVGQSVACGPRIATHTSSNKVFDRAFVLATPPSELDRLEAAFIRALQPEENVVMYSGNPELDLNSFAELGYAAAPTNADSL